jgi:hypothetical protein
MARLREVEALERQGISLAESAERLEVSVQTVSLDRARIRELWAEEGTKSREDHIHDLEFLEANLWQSYTALGGSEDELEDADGTKRLGHYNSDRTGIAAQIRSTRKLIAELDGSLVRGGGGGVAVQVNVAIGEGEMEPTLEELWTAGKITEAELQTGLRLMAIQSGTEFAPAAVIEAQAVEVVAAVPAALLPPPAEDLPAHSVPVASNGNGHRKVQRFEDIDPEDEEA